MNVHRFYHIMLVINWHAFYMNITTLRCYFERFVRLVDSKNDKKVHIWYKPHKRYLMIAFSHSVLFKISYFLFTSKYDSFCLLRIEKYKFRWKNLQDDELPVAKSLIDAIVIFDIAKKRTHMFIYVFNISADTYFDNYFNW